MKNAISISLVILLMLNVMGYYGLFLGLKYKNTLRVTKKIDAQDYRESETVTFKIPLSIPYSGDTEFQRVDGEIEHDGQFYRLVKQKLQDDTLHIVCIRDARAARLHEALADYVNTFTHQSADRTNSKTIQSFIKDYYASSFSLYCSAAGWSASLHPKEISFFLTEVVQTFPSPPPKS